MVCRLNNCKLSLEIAFLVAEVVMVDMAVRRNSNFSFIDMKKEGPKWCSMNEREKKESSNINRLRERCWQYPWALLSCGPVSCGNRFVGKQGYLRHDRTSVTDDSGNQRRYALNVPNCQKVWVNQLEVLDSQRQNAISGKSASVSGNRRSRRDYDLYGRSDSMAGNISSRTMRDLTKKGPGRVTSYKMRVMAASVRPHVRLRNDKNRRVFRRGLAECRFPPVNEILERNYSSKSRNVTYRAFRVSEKPGKLKNSVLKTGGRESNGVITRGDNLPRRSRLIKQVINVETTCQRIPLRVAIIRNWKVLLLGSYPIPSQQSRQSLRRVIDNRVHMQTRVR